jgi:hypothetical protein
MESLHSLTRSRAILNECNRLFQQLPAEDWGMVKFWIRIAKNYGRTVFRSYVAQPINIATTATVSVIPCTRIGTHKLRPERR